MKKLFIFLALLTSSLLLAQTPGLNQSYILLDNGKVLLTRAYFPNDNTIKLFSPADYLFDSKNIKYKKSNYIIDREQRLFTISSDGFMYMYNDIELDSRIIDAGGSFFITRKGSIIVIKNNGSYHENYYETIKSEFGSRINAKVTGGNFFITRQNEVYAINNITGKINKMSVEINTNDIEHLGNNFLVKKDGEVFTFGMIKNENNNYNLETKIYRNSNFKRIRHVGGNFFFDFENNIHTISYDGTLNQGNEKRKVRVSISQDNVDRSFKIPFQIGGNYFIYRDGAVYIVDHNGYYYHLETIDPRIEGTNR
ncbi:MAG: hypothetical protein N4A33_07910 [Bacteriovoracaceae bacterium]|jgi:hypothetical protein|nr:hypothetical protein [Bacteriovoracaceae bacterium]